MLQEFVQEVTNTVQKILQGVHTTFPGVLTAFDPATGLANVQPKMKFRKPDGTTIDYPQITGVPVVFPQSMGQKSTIAYPIKAGDGCLVFVAEQSIDFWMYGQETETDLAFDPSNSICIVGMFVSANSVMQDACSQNAVIVDVGGTRFAVKNDGLIQADCKRFVINASDSFKVNAGRIDLN